MNAFEAFTSIRFDWTASVHSIWKDSKVHVSEVYGDVLDHILKGWSAIEVPDVAMPLEIVLGEGGLGKTHLLSVLRREVVARGGTFLLGDMTDVVHFWDTINQGIVNSLVWALPDGTTQLEACVSAILRMYGVEALEGVSAQEFAELRPPALMSGIRALLDRTDRSFGAHLDVLKALLLLTANDSNISRVGDAWLRGLDVSEDDLFIRDLPGSPKKSFERVRSLAWVLGLRGPVVLAIDRFDAIASEARAYREAGKVGAVSGIHHRVARGLWELCDVMPRARTVATLQQRNWLFLEEVASTAVSTRYRPPLRLGEWSGSALEGMLVRRLEGHYAKVGFDPPYPTFPFRPEAFSGLALAPRMLLRRAEDHRLRCKRSGEITELRSFAISDVHELGSPGPVRGHPLDLRMRELSAGMEPFGGDGDSSRSLERLMEVACRCLTLENPQPWGKDVAVDLAFDKGREVPFYVRIRVIDREAGDRERHFGVCVAYQTDAISFQTRIKNALIESGIGDDLPFRKLIIVRNGPLPGGSTTKVLVDELRQRGGVFVVPDIEELQDLAVLYEILEEAPEGLDRWLQSHRRVSQMGLFKDAASFLFGHPSAAMVVRAPPVEVKASNDKTPVNGLEPIEFDIAEVAIDSLTVMRPSDIDSQAIALGVELSGADHGLEILLPLEALAKHVSVVAAAGSGQKVLVRRIVEEAALRGIPSVVIDVCNDLVLLGDRWPDEADDAIDRRSAARYFDRTETIVWTPGLDDGNPLSANPIPDFGSVRAHLDELNMAIDLAHRGLLEELSFGPGQITQTQKAILRKALSMISVSNESSLDVVARLLDDPPSLLADGFSDGKREARQLADGIRAVMALNPLLRPDGALVDFDTLFGLGGCKTRISVVNLEGLATVNRKRAFVGRLMTMLFTWVRRYPTQGRIKGLVVIDEIKDLAPAGSSAVSLEPILQLAMQARRCGVGMVLATQEPKDIHPQVVSHFGTQIFGRASAPAVQEIILGMMEAQPGDDSVRLASLGEGEFYCAMLGDRLRRMRSHSCLSYHSVRSVASREVRERAAGDRRRLFG